MRWRELLDAYADWMDRLVGPLTDDPPSPERAKPDNQQASARAPLEVFLNLHDDYIRSLLADATETITNPYSKDTDMPAFNQVSGITPNNTIEELANKLHPTGLTARIRTEGTNPAGGPSVIHIDTDAVEPRLAYQAPEDRRLADAVRHVANAKSPYTYTTQIMGVKIARCDSRGRTDAERAEYQRGLREGRLDNTVVRAEVVGSSEWLRDLADRLQQHITNLGFPNDPDHRHTTPRGIRFLADKVERDEHKAVADTRDRERVEQIVLRQWETAARATVDAALASLGEVVGVDLANPAPEYDVAGFWATLTAEQQAEALAPALELYRAGRDDQEADR